MLAEKLNDVRLIHRRYEQIVEAPENLTNKRDQIDLLFQLCIERLSDVDHVSFTTLFSRIAFLKNVIPISSKHSYQLQSFRRVVEKRDEHLNEEESYAFGQYVMSILFHYALGEPLMDIPNFLIDYGGESLSFEYFSFGLIYRSDKEYHFVAEKSPDKNWELNIVNAGQRQQLKRISAYQKAFIPACIIHASFDNVQDIVSFDAFVLMPNYLVDVTNIAESFKPGGKLPQSYLVKKFIAPQKKLPLLQGNVANHILDNLVYKRDSGFNQLMSEAFHQDPLPYLKYEDKEMRSFIQDSRRHYSNISAVLDHQLADFGIDIRSTYTEPTFLSNIYGLQGRLDVLHQSDDRKRNNIVELKSGSAYRPNAYGISVNHYTQTLLYDLLINSSLGTGSKVSSYILYSKLDKDQLRFAPKASSLQYEALSLRNDLVYIDLILKHIDEDEAFTIFNNIVSAKSNAIDRFIKEDLIHLSTALSGLNSLEMHYFRSFVAFVAREHLIAKIGEHGIERSNGLAGLWLDSLEEKREQFRILSHLTIVENLTKEKDPILILSRSNKSNKLSRFRKGDIVILYPWRQHTESPLKNQVFKSTIIDLSKNQVTIRLRNPQYNQTIFEDHEYWNLEGDVLDSGFLQMYRNLMSWMSLPERTRALYMGLKQPEIELESAVESTFQGVTSEQAVVLKKAITAKDYFLIWGPPGTGKTSVVIRELVRYYRMHNKPILILSYTNRAVDEICEAVASVDEENPLDFLRIGSKYACQPKFQGNLLVNVSAACSNRQELADRIKSTDIFVSTIASIHGKKEIFDLKAFEAVIVDEASQLLEPALLGILPNAKKLILVGDHKQLAAVVQQGHNTVRCKFPELEKDIALSKLDNSLFERLIMICKEKAWTANFGTLSYQGRMHKDIMAFPSEHFYAGNLKPLDQIARLHASIVPDGSFKTLVLSKRNIFIDAPIDRSLTSKTNVHEAEIVRKLISLFVSFLRSESSDLGPKLGVITPYRAQIALIDSQLESELSTGEKITIDTVERFQGGSRDHIVFSMCVNTASQLSRNHSGSEVDLNKKFNVAITRARESLIILGNREMLSQNILYKQWIDHAYELNVKDLEKFLNLQSNQFSS